MRSALLISLGLHVAVSLLALVRVRFHAVEYVPRAVYNVTLVTPSEARPATTVRPREPAPPPKAEPKPPPEPKPEPPPPEPEKPRPEPRRRPKPAPRPRRVVERAEVAPPDTTRREATEPAPAQTGAMAFDAADFPYAYYIGRMRRKIAARWRAPSGTPDAATCRVYFRVHRDGSVSDVGVEESSGIFLFDQSAERAVITAAPFPPLPREFSDAWLGVHFTFAFRERR